MKKVQRHGSSGECKLKPVSDDFTLIRWLELKGLTAPNVTLKIVGRSVKMVQPLWKKAWQVLIKFKVH